GSLMGGEAAEVEAKQERPAFEPLQIGVVFLLHLAMQDLDAVEAHVGGQVDAGFDAAQLLVAKLPVRVSGNGYAVRARRWHLGIWRLAGGRLRRPGQQLGAASPQGQNGGRT